jgi:two-component system, OmpR family, response regulator
MTNTSDAPTRLLIVDDDAGVRDVVRRYFSAQGFELREAGDAASAKAAIAREPIDLVLLDLGLPGEDGLTLARYLRDRWQGAVIIVSGRGDPVDRVVGLEIGADDYVSKPFDLRELLARVRSVLRRTRPAPATAESGRGWIEFEGMRLNPAARQLLDASGRELSLTTGEYDLLAVLLEQPNRVLTRDALMQRLHGRESGPYDRAIDVQVGRLRQKIERDPANPTLIRSVRGVGYLFAASVRTATP